MQLLAKVSGTGDLMVHISEGTIAVAKESLLFSEHRRLWDAKCTKFRVKEALTGFVEVYPVQIPCSERGSTAIEEMWDDA